MALEPRLTEERGKRRQQNLRSDQIQLPGGERSTRNMNQTNCPFKTENSELVPQFRKETKSSYMAQNSTGHTPLTAEEKYPWPPKFLLDQSSNTVPIISLCLPVFTTKRVDEQNSSRKRTTSYRHFYK